MGSAVVAENLASLSVFNNSDVVEFGVSAKGIEQCAVVDVAFVGEEDAVADVGGYVRFEVPDGV